MKKSQGEKIQSAGFWAFFGKTAPEQCQKLPHDRIAADQAGVVKTVKRAETIAHFQPAGRGGKKSAVRLFCLWTFGIFSGII